MSGLKSVKISVKLCPADHQSLFFLKAGFDLPSSNVAVGFRRLNIAIELSCFGKMDDASVLDYIAWHSSVKARICRSLFHIVRQLLRHGEAIVCEGIKAILTGN